MSQSEEPSSPTHPAPLKKESKAFFQALGNYIALLRKESGMTQAELARALGVSQQAVFAYETGERRLSVLLLIKVRRIFRISLDDLVGMVPVQAPSKNRKLTPQAMRQAQKIANLTKTEQRFVIRIIDELEASGARKQNAKAQGSEAPEQSDTETDGSMSATSAPQADTAAENPA